MSFERLYNIVEEELHLSSLRQISRTKDIHSTLLGNEEVREILEIETPMAENISETLEVSKGRVYAVRFDKTFGETGFKKPVIASLILKRLIESVKRGVFSKKWIDGGNVNSSLALGYYAKKFNGEATYIMSRFFPEYVLDYVKETSQNSIDIIKAPNLKLGIERDFYKYLVNLIRFDKKFKKYQPLWHAKFSGEYSEVLGQELANSLNFCPDYIVVAVGAGSTLEGQAIPIKREFNNSPKIIVPEHAKSALLHSSQPLVNVFENSIDNKEYPASWFSNPPEGIPHYVIGPHYDEINPLLKKSILAEIDGVYTYYDDDWKQLSYECYNKSMEIGNSSAANLFIAKTLADQGSNVLTFIYEPFRSFYRGHNVSIENYAVSNHFFDLNDRSSICFQK